MPLQRAEKSDRRDRAAAGGARRWRVERVAHPALPLLVARDEVDAVVFVGFDNATGDASAALAKHASRHGACVDGQDATSAVGRQLSEYLAGQRRDFDLRVSLLGTEFQRAAWHALREIPFGQTRSYGDQAHAIGRPTAVRAIGRANGDNPVPVVVPCHRVIGADGSLTGFGGGVDVKRWLLALERDPAHPPAWCPDGTSPRHARRQLGLFG